MMSAPEIVSEGPRGRDTSRMCSELLLSFLMWDLLTKACLGGDASPGLIFQKA